MNDIWNTIVTFLEQNEFIQKTVFSILVLIALFITLAIVRKVLKSIEQRDTKNGAFNQRLKTILNILKSIIKYTLWIFAFIFILAIWGVNVLPALAGLGIIGLVIGLGAQKMISDMIAGFFIIFEKHFNVGDNIEVSGFRGTVVDFGLKSTTLQSWKGEIKIFSNSDMTPVINYSKYHATAVVNFKVPYGTNLEKIIKKMNDALIAYESTNDLVTTTPSVVGVSDLMNTMIQFTIVCQTKANGNFGVEREIRKLVIETLNLQGVQIPLENVVASHMES